MTNYLHLCTKSKKLVFLIKKQILSKKTEKVIMFEHSTVTQAEIFFLNHAITILYIYFDVSASLFFPSNILFTREIKENEKGNTKLLNTKQYKLGKFASFVLLMVLQLDIECIWL